ncbi:hypothetical protein AAFF_G00416910 [Aldrovandia affinis]|uniref:Uncharacterized protein n=1 Tax=Aldrovandia affinis TaxID=143900 RepID=A0AAD7SAN3_9TELE|nr:hypothetical protein AAFF_G00416910 [Aldrovandia affinis]
MVTWFQNTLYISTAVSQSQVPSSLLPLLCVQPHRDPGPTGPGGNDVQTAWTGLMGSPLLPPCYDSFALERTAALRNPPAHRPSNVSLQHHPATQNIGSPPSLLGLPSRFPGLPLV